MSFTHSITLGWSDGSSQNIAKTVAKEGQIENNLSVEIAASTTHHEIALAFAFANLQSIFISSDKPLTLKFNDSGTPEPQIDIDADAPFAWYDGCGIANPFEADVTTLFVTNAEVTAAALEIRTLTTE